MFLPSREEAGAEALHYGALTVSAGRTEKETGAESDEAETTGYGTLTGNSHFQHLKIAAVLSFPLKVKMHPAKTKCIFLLSEQIAVRSCPSQCQNKQIVLNPIDQQPVR